MEKLDVLKLNFFKLESLLIYRKLLEDRIFGRIRSLVLSLDSDISQEHVFKYYQICYELIEEAEKEGFQGDLLQNYIVKLIAIDENPFSLSYEKNGYDISPSLYQAAIHDLNIIKGILKFTLADIGSLIIVEELSFIRNYSTNYKKSHSSLYQNFNQLKQTFFKEKADTIVDYLAEYYNIAGSGELCQYSSFRYVKKLGLVGISVDESVNFDDIIGYEEQKNKLIENTEVFLSNKKANNVLLYGDSGTGKSSSMKALINSYFAEGLRLVEIRKDQIKYIPQLLEILKKRGLYFIIFMDDLSFEDFETDYKYLKAVMEGGIEGEADNILFYATTNRRHLVKEKWQDRENLSDINQADGQEEILSLSERFGITITYLSPDQNEYLEIVKRLAIKNSLSIPEQELVDMALKWEKWHHGRSGRTARQFVNYLLGTNVS